MAEKKPVAPKAESKFPMYNDKPLVRCGDTIYYGNMKDPYVIQMEIKSKKEMYGEQIADTILLRLLSTDSSLPPEKQIVKVSEKNGMYAAMDIATVWLNRYLKKSQETPAKK